MHPLTIVGFLVIMLALTLILAFAAHRITEYKMHKKYGDVIRRRKGSLVDLKTMPTLDKAAGVVALVVAVPAILFVIYALGK